MRPTIALLINSHWAYGAAGFPVHSLSPAFLREMLGSPTASPSRAEQPIINKATSWLREKWDALDNFGIATKDQLAKKIAGLTEKQNPIPTTPPPTNFHQPSTRETAQTTAAPKTQNNVNAEQSDSASDEFAKLYRGWEHTMPSWDSVLSKLRCDKIHSFSSCAQHCFTLIPDYGNGERPNDISSSLIPRADASAWWKTSGDLKRTKVNTSQTFGMSPADIRDFKACVFNVCIGDYITNEQTPGCIGPKGDIALETGGRSSVDPELDELDFYHPEKAEFYKRYGIFTFSRFLQMVIPQCDLSSPDGCRLEPGFLFNLAFFILMFGAPAIFVVTFSQVITPMVYAHASGDSGRSPLVDRSLKARAFKMLANVNRWLAKQEHLVEQLWAYMSNAADRQTSSVHDGYELIVRGPEQSIVR